MTDSKSNPRCGFSLVELLAVMAVISILGSLTVAGLGSFPARNVSKAVSVLNSVAVLARQEAMSKGTPVALIVLTGTAHDVESLGQAVLLVSLTRQAGSAVQLKAVTPWMRLPVDALMEPYKRDGDATFYIAGTGSLPAGALPAKLNGGYVDAGYSYIVFQPDAAVDAAGIGPALTFQRRHPANSRIDYTMLVQENSGRTKVISE
ncbi:MAG: prepilin-type N-terminal cleavage/methylation domain-containing protein [Chthoniobacterales bacterium]